MAVKFRAIGNFFQVYDSSTNEKYISEVLDAIKYKRNSSDVFTFHPKEPFGNTTQMLNQTIIGNSRNEFPFADILDYRTGASFASADALEDYLASILGNFSSTGALTNISHGLFAQILQSTAITSTGEASLLGSGVGTLLIPANTLSVGDSYHAKIGGVCHISGGGSPTMYRIKVKSGTTILADSGIATGEWSSNLPFECEIDFTIRTVGATGSIQTNANFVYRRDSNERMVGVMIDDNEAIDTTVDNTLGVTFEFTTFNTSNSIYSNNFTLVKTY